MLPRYLASGSMPAARLGHKTTSVPDELTQAGKTKSRSENPSPSSVLVAASESSEL